MLKKRVALCGVAYRRHGAAARKRQRGSAPCDLPCDGACVPDCELPNMNCGRRRSLDIFCDACSCDGPSRKHKKKWDEEKYIYLSRKVGKS